MATKTRKNASSQLSDLRVTVYPSYALVQGTYELKLEKGANKVRLEGLPTHYDPDSLHVLSFEGEGEVTLGASSYRGANLNANALQAKALNQKVTVRFGGNLPHEQQTLKGTLLNLSGNVALIGLKGGDVREVRNVVGFEYDGIPDGLSNRPTLTMNVEASCKGKYRAVILYKALGLSWSAGYKWIWDDKAGTVTIDGSVFTTNQSGASYDNASLKVVAGDAGQEDDVQHEAVLFSAAAAPAGGGMRSSRKVNQAVAENLGQVKVFTVPGQVNVEEGERQKVPFLFAEGVPVRAEYRVGFSYGWHNARGEKQEAGVRTNLCYKNDADSKLGKALPTGFVQVMQSDASGTLLKSGGGTQKDMAVGEEDKLDIGSDFDLKAWRVVEAQEKVPARKDKAAEVTTEPAPEAGAPEVTPTKRKSSKPKQKKFYVFKKCAVELFNGKGYPVEFVVEEYLTDDCKFDGKHSLKETTAGRFEQRVQVAAGQKETLRFTIKQEVVEEVVEAE